MNRAERKARLEAVSKFLESFSYKPGWSFKITDEEGFVTLAILYEFKPPSGECGSVALEEHVLESMLYDKGEFLRLLWESIDKLESFERLHWFRINGEPYCQPKYRQNEYSHKSGTTFFPSFKYCPLT